jgi:FG-GAP-like repeat/FG-GAP repeat
MPAKTAHLFVSRSCAFRSRITRFQILYIAFMGMLFVGGSARVCAQDLTLTATSGGQTAATVPYGSTVVLTATGGGTGTVTFCAAGTHACAGTAQFVKGTAVFSFVPPAGCQNYTAYSTMSFSNTVPLMVTMSSVGKEQPTTTAITSSGSAGNYSLTATVTGYLNPALVPAPSAAPTGTVSFLDTSNANASLGTATLGVGTLAQSFSACGAPPVDSEPQSIATADFNGDGISDLAVANLFGPTVTILLGNGDGTFTQSQDLTTPGIFPPGVASGNFGGGHGNTDLVVSNGLASSPEVTFYLSDGTGTFAQGASVALPGTPTQVAVSLDGSYIAAPSGSTTGQVTFISTASGHAVKQTVQVGNNPEGVVAMSFGVVVTQFNNPGTVTVLKGAPGSFTTLTPISVGSLPFGIAAGDFKSSGVARDLAVANNGDDTVSVLYGNGSGGFTAGPILNAGQGPFGVITGDFNGDGKTDIAVANKTDNTVSVFFGNGDGTFQGQVVMAAGDAPGMLAVGNFSGHGPVDLAVTNAADNTASIFLSQITQTATATASNVKIPVTGTHLVDAKYPGNTKFNPSVSVAINPALSVGTPAVLTTPAPGSTLAGASVKFTWTAETGSAGYWLFLGTTGVGSKNLYDSNEQTATSATFSNLPTDGATIYARVYTSYNGTLVFNDYTYTASMNAPVLTSPTPGSTLSSASATFTWTAEAGGQGYWLFLGTTGVGSSNLYDSHQQAATSATFSSLPTNGETIYARVYTDYNGVLVFNDYTYKAWMKPPVLTTPTPGSTLAGASATFTWTAEAGSAGYWLFLGTTGAGSKNLYDSNEQKATSATFSNLPTNGVTVYARVYASYNGVLVFNDYTYKAK